MVSFPALNLTMCDVALYNSLYLFMPKFICVGEKQDNLPYGGILKLLVCQNL